MSSRQDLGTQFADHGSTRVLIPTAHLHKVRAGASARLHLASPNCVFFKL